MTTEDKALATDLSALACRVMDLQGPSREVDAEIMFDLYAKPCGVLKIDGGPRGYLWPEDNPSWNFGLRFPGKNRNWFEEQRQGVEGERLLIERDGALVLMNDLRIPHLTASLDAAMTLVPPHTVAVSFDLEFGLDGETCGAILTIASLAGNQEVRAVAKTHFNALTAAALLARGEQS
jgi:hypothetical protein